ncbi:hypothetical protein AX774_g1117, partial [Zancudomyces culisetae]
MLKIVTVIMLIGATNALMAIRKDV